MAYTLNDNLKRWAEQYETAEFIQSDPVQIPHRYDSRVNIEISAFVTAWIAWGSRKQIIQKADFIDREIFKGAPYHYIVGTDVASFTDAWIETIVLLTWIVLPSRIFYRCVDWNSTE